MKILIKNGTVVDPSQNINGKYDVLIEAGIITEIKNEINMSVDKTIDASGKHIVPGLIDMHVHLRDPGFLEKETIHTGAEAAINGGFTSIVCMPNTSPVIDSVETVKYIKEESKKTKINIYAMGSITKGLKGGELSDYKKMKEEGIVGVTDDGMTVMNAKIMYEGLLKAKENDLPVSVHCEDPDLVYDNTVNRGGVSKELGLEGRPNISEEIIVQRDINLAETTGGRIHIQHISAAISVELVRQAKKKGINVTCEVTPHHFSLTESAILEHQSNAKMSPPLRSENDLNAILEGLKDGTIDVIATDHAPHTLSDKNKDILNAANGIVGLETALGLAINNLLHTKVLTFPQLIEKMSKNPSDILKLNKGTLKEGSEANITIIDIEKTWTVDKTKFKSKGKNTPFDKIILKGKTEGIIVKETILLSAEK